MHTTARQGILSLLEKPKKDVLLVKSWRPLTILNADNKLYGKILANRLVCAADEVIHHTQTGFIKGRSAAENILKIMELISFSEAQKLDNLLISCDFEKAFDSVEWEAIFQILVAFNFGPNFLDMILTLFNEPSICVSNNGFWSTFWTPM